MAVVTIYCVRSEEFLTFSHFQLPRVLWRTKRRSDGSTRIPNESGQIFDRIILCIFSLFTIGRYHTSTGMMKFALSLFISALALATAFVPSPGFTTKRLAIESPSILFMGDVTPTTIKELRDATGAGMMDCKKALLETEGDQEAAAEYLRKKGLAKADKKASRVAAEGKIAIKSDGRTAVMVEVNCETDFVAKDDNFLGFCEKVAGAAVLFQVDSVEGLMTQEVDGESLEETRKALVAKIGENIQVRRLASGGGDGKTVG